MNRLQILKPGYYEHYRKKQNFTLRKHFNKLKAIPISIESFRFYISTSAIHSSQIEGIDVDYNSWMRYQDMPEAFKSKDLVIVEDLVNAYEYSRKHSLSYPNMLKVHAMLSKHTLSKAYRGKYREKMAYVYNVKTRQKVYEAAPVEIVEAEMKKLFADIEALKKRELTIDQVFYYASMIHLVFVNIHPFVDGNGRMARLLEKWFLAEKLGQNAWFIQSERNYHKKRISYYRNIHTGKTYESLDYDLCLDFLLMLPWSLKIK